jgi:hypothetical protein
MAQYSVEIVVANNPRRCVKCKISIEPAEVAVGRCNGGSEFFYDTKCLKKAGFDVATVEWEQVAGWDALEDPEAVKAALTSPSQEKSHKRKEPAPKAKASTSEKPKKKAKGDGEKKKKKKKKKDKNAPKGPKNGFFFCFATPNELL